GAPAERTVWSESSNRLWHSDLMHSDSGDCSDIFMVWLPQAGVRIIVACALPNWQDVGAALHGVVAFLKSRDFAINFVANLAGAMIGILLAFWIERFRSRRETKML